MAKATSAYRLGKSDVSCDESSFAMYVIRFHQRYKKFECPKIGMPFESHGQLIILILPTARFAETRSGCCYSRKTSMSCCLEQPAEFVTRLTKDLDQSAFEFTSIKKLCLFHVKNTV